MSRASSVGDGEVDALVDAGTRARPGAEALHVVVRPLRLALRPARTPAGAGLTPPPQNGVGLVKSLALVDDTAQPTAAEIEVRRIETFDDFLAASEIQWEAFAITPETTARLQRPHLREDFDRGRSTASPSTSSPLSTAVPPQPPRRSPPHVVSS